MFVLFSNYMLTIKPNLYVTRLIRDIINLHYNNLDASITGGIVNKNKTLHSPCTALVL